LKSKFLSVGFSRGHDAAFMNRIANMGNEQGNFAFIDSYNDGWRDELNNSLMD
jgi:mannitol-1-phosphate/altronate dehydrogenase